MRGLYFWMLIAPSNRPQFVVKPCFERVHTAKLALNSVADNLCAKIPVECVGIQLETTRCLFSF